MFLDGHEDEKREWELKLCFPKSFCSAIASLCSDKLRCSEKFYVSTNLVLQALLLAFLPWAYSDCLCMTYTYILPLGCCQGIEPLHTIDNRFESYIIKIIHESFSSS